MTFEERDSKTLVVMHDLYSSKQVLDDATASGSASEMSELFKHLDPLLFALGASS